MKLTFAMIVVLLPLAATGQSAAKSAPPAKKASTAPQPLEIPKDAVETEPGTFRHTDAKGIKWIYRKTPFGIARLEDKDEAVAAAAKAAPAQKEEKVRVVEKGDTVLFERPGPFGLYKWERKKGDLNEAERGWLEQQRSRTTARTGAN